MVAYHLTTFFSSVLYVFSKIHNQGHMEVEWNTEWKHKKIEKCSDPHKR